MISLRNGKRKNQGSLEEKKDDRCTRIAKSKYDVWPSAYASGAVVKCRQGKIWKGVKEDIKKIVEEEIQNVLGEECWKGYKQAGMKEKGGRMVPNCVPVQENELEEKKKKTDYSKEKESGLHGWFSRQGGKGKSKGWVDCNTCRKDKKTGKKNL
jgi:hypothetical protein